jgi:hypothetical protein
MDSNTNYNSQQKNAQNANRTSNEQNNNNNTLKVHKFLFKGDIAEYWYGEDTSTKRELLFLIVEK